MKCKFLRFPCELRFDRYRSTNNLAVELVVDDPKGKLEDTYHGEPVTVATTNLTPLPDDRIALKNWSENAGIVESLVKAGFIEPDPCDGIEAGFTHAPVHKLTEAAIAEIRAAGL